MKKEKLPTIKSLKANFRLITCTFFGVLVLFSCDTTVHINKVVYNSSDYDLKLISKYNNKEIIIPKKSSDTIEVHTDYANKVYENYNRCGVGSYDSIIVEDNNNLSISKSLGENDNWMYSVVSKRVGRCIIIISNDDIN